jgi:outer membrane protein OmpA-like peptidoglycan-associated protein
MRRNRAFWRHLPAAIAVLAVASTTVACGTGNPGTGSTPVTDVAVVVSVHRNAPKIPRDRLLDALPQLTNGSHLLAVGVDGSVDGTNISERTIGTAKSGDDRRKAIANAKLELADKIDGAAAQEPESDPLGAIAVAARRLKGGIADKTLIIADPLLPTTGDLQFQRIGFDWTTEDIWERLTSRKPSNLPELQGIHVVVIGLGATMPPQPALDEGRIKQLEDLWRTILVRSGAKDKKVDFVPAGVGDVLSPSRQQVSVIPVKRTPLPDPKPGACQEQVLSETVVQFKSDSAEFLAPEAARAAAERVANAFKSCPGRLTVTGTTSSWGTEAGRKRVSTGRAEAFRSLLAEVLGVPAATVVAVGVGMHFPAFVNDRSGAGDLIPELAIRNRTVRVTVSPGRAD